MKHLNPDRGSRTADGRFVKGCPAGPGRPRKAIRAAADAIDERVAQAAGSLIDVALKQANEGNLAAVKLLLDRLWPAGRRPALDVTTEGANHARDLLAVQTVVTDSVLAGETSAREGARVSRLLQDHLKVLDTAQVRDFFGVYLREKYGFGE